MGSSSGRSRAIRARASSSVHSRKWNVGCMSMQDCRAARHCWGMSAVFHVWWMTAGMTAGPIALALTARYVTGS